MKLLSRVSGLNRLPSPILVTIGINDLLINLHTGQLNSPYKRSAEIDLLQRLMKKQNDGTARAKAAIAKEALSHFVHQQILMGNSWKTPVQMAVMRRQTAEAKELEPYLSKRYKMYRPARRPR